MEAQHNPMKNKNSKRSCQIEKSCPLYSVTENHSSLIVLVEPLPELRTSMLNNTEKTLARYSKQKSWNAHIRQQEAGLYCFVATHVPILFVSLKTLLKNLDGSSFITRHTALISWLPLVLKLVEFGERCFVSDDNAKTCVQQWLSSMPASFYEEGMKCSFM